MTVVVAVIIAGVLCVGIGMAIGLLLARRARARTDPVFGTPVAPSATASGPPSLDPADVTGLTDGLHAAMADGDLSDDEIQRLLPGAEVHRQGDGVTAAWQSTSSTERIQGPDGQVYESIDDIPDPELRERLRRLIGD